MKHNPQNFTPEQFGGPDGNRLLTVEEMAVLSDREAVNTPNGFALFGHLLPEYFNESRCAWNRAISGFEGQPIIPLEVGATYRTAAPELVASDGPPFDGVEFDGTWFKSQASCFIVGFGALAGMHHTLMRQKGFWKAEDDLRALLLNSGRQDLLATLINAFDGQKLALVTSEVSECLEGLRDGNGADDKIATFLSSEAEYADVMLRLMDHAHARGWRVAEAVVEKLQMNATRAAKHGRAF